MLIFDLETDGFLCDVSVVHCLCIYDTETKETTVYNDQAFNRATDQPAKNPIIRGVQFLEDADTVCGHNIIGYDLPVLRKLYPWFRRTGDCLDTLVLSRLYHPNLMEIDKKRKWANMPLQLYGRHSLEAYGHRLGEFKGEFGKTANWKEWSPEMQQYMIQDVQVTRKLWDHFHHKFLTGSN